MDLQAFTNSDAVLAVFQLFLAISTGYIAVTSLHQVHIMQGKEAPTDKRQLWINRWMTFYFTAMSATWLLSLLLISFDLTVAYVRLLVVLAGITYILFGSGPWMRAMSSQTIRIGELMWENAKYLGWTSAGLCAIYLGAFFN
jgi:hypothetical protein